MKKIDIPLWTDTLFLFAAAGALGFCVLRFYIPSAWGAAAAALASAAAATFPLHLWLRARRRKKRGAESEKKEAAALAFHLAMQPPEQNARLIADCLAASDAQAGRAAAPAEKPAEKPASAPAEKPAEKPASAPVPARGGTVRAGKTLYFLLFRLDKVTADELRAAVRAEGERTVLGGAFTAEAEKLAAAFRIELWDAEKVYALVKGARKLPSPLFAPPPAARGARRRLRLRRSAWRGYAFSGGFLLLFSLWAIFPIYYLVAGGLLLAAAAAVKIFGK